jgi:3-oxoacyl-[acyl-carrier protein] reductase
MSPSLSSSRAARKVAVVTGGARGIGRGAAQALAQKEFDIVLVDILGSELDRTAEELRGYGARVCTKLADTSDFAAAQSIGAAIEKDWGRVDFLLNNAGRASPKGILEISESEWDETIDVNLKSCFNWCKAIVPLMLAQGGGRIVNMSSLSAFTGGVTAAISKFSYAAAKAGIIGLTRALAKELGPSIFINAICPGIIKTELGNSLIRSREADLVKGIALGRLGSPADVAALVTFLATVDPNFITGQAFIVDGCQWNT